MYLIGFMGLLLTISTIFLFSMGCRPDGSPSHPQDPNRENKKETVEVTVGGKVWNINPDLSYRATGVWTNPSPRPLTDVEKARIVALKAQIQALETQLNELDTELGTLERIEEPEIKFRFRFGAPRNPLLPPDFSSSNIINLGKFPMEIESYTKTPSEQ